MIWQRIKNLWYWSKLEPPRDAYFESEKGRESIVKNLPLLSSKLTATVVPYKPRNPVQEIVGDEKAI